MATVDLVNDIEPKHPFRPVKVALEDLRNAISAADTGGLYSDSYLGSCTRNDLIAIARHLGVELPFGYVAPVPVPADWAATTAYSVGDQVSVTGGQLQATAAGTSGATAPANPASVGGTVTDGTVTWVRIK